MLLVPGVPQTTNNVPGPGTDGLLLTLTSTPPARTSQTKSSPSTPPAGSTTFCSSRLLELSGARVTMIGNKVTTVTIWMIGLPENKKMRRSVILMVVKEVVPLLDQTVLPANMKTSSTAHPLDFAFTRTWCVMAIHIQAAEEMMKALIAAMKSITRRGLSRDTQP